MTRQDAQRLIEAFARSEAGPDAGSGTGPVGLNPQGLGGVATADGQLYFEFDERSSGLLCSALVYRFRDAPRPGLLEALEAEAAAGTDTGGGKVQFEPASRGLFLSRTWVAVPETTVFERELRRLTKAGTAWSEGVFPRVAQRVLHPGGAR